MATLDIVVLVVYIAFLNPVLFCLWKHGKPGILAWLSLQMFCLVRIVGSIINIHYTAIHASSTSTPSLILSNIGLSPLIIATAGVLHEARTARNPNINKRLEWFKVISFHLLVVGAMCLVIFGVFNEINNAPHTPTNRMKIGAVILAFSWNILSIWTLLSWYRTPENSMENAAFGDGSTLLYGVLRALPFIGIREIYALLSVFIKNPSFKTNTTAKVILSVVPEMLVTLILVFVGIQTRNIGKLRNMNKA